MKSERPKEIGTPVLVRLQAGPLKKIDAWRRGQPDLPSRPEAIRRLVDLALAQPRSRSDSPKPRARSRAADDTPPPGLSKSETTAWLRKRMAGK